jgi:UDP-glucose:glycoprotein glucosyltransferase
MSSSTGYQLSSPTAVLYANPFSSNFWSLHLRLTEYVLGSRLDSPPLQYVFRWKPIANLNDSYLTGYGAFLDLKKVDYLVIDDRKLTDTAAVQAGDEQASLAGTEHSLEDQRWMEKQLRTSEDDRKQSVGSLTSEELAGMSYVLSILDTSTDITSFLQIWPSKLLIR